MIDVPPQIKKIIQEIIRNYSNKVRELSQKKKAIVDQAVQDLERKKPQP